MKRTAPSLLALSLLLVACSAGGSGGSSNPEPSGGGDSGAVEHPTESDQAISIIDHAGGMIPISGQVGQTPAFVLLGDGRVILQGMQTLIFPGPALPPLIERTLTEAGIQAVLAEIGDTDLFTADLELRGLQNVVMDASDTIFTMDAAGRQATVSIYGLGTLTPMPGEEQPQGISSAELQAHQVLQSLQDQMLNLDTWLPDGSWEDEGWKPYEPDAFRLYVRDATGEPVEGGDLPEQVRPWPVDGDPASFGTETNFGDGTRCGVVDGEEAARWLEELSAATQLTRWAPGNDPDARFSVAPRPLLPHEEATCPELIGA